jgi:hypothetical protein
MKLAGLLFVWLFVSLNVGGAASASMPPGSLSKPAAPPAKATVLFDIEIAPAAAETRVQLKADGAITDYREVRLQKNVAAGRPDRMYLDIKNVRLAGPIPAKRVGTALAKVRTGPRTDGFRVVFDSSLDGLFDYTISEQPDGLLITIREPAAEPAAIAAMIPAAEPEAAPEKIIVGDLVTIYPEPRAAGDLNLLIVPADSPEQAREWLNRSPDRNIGMQIMRTAKPEQDINTSFLVTGVSADRDGDFSVEVSFALVDPSGQLVSSKRRFAKTSGRAPTTPAFFIADPELDIILGESDPAGEYTIIGSVEDLTTNKVFRTSRRIKLAKETE